MVFLLPPFSFCLSCLVVFYFLIGFDEVQLKFFWSFDSNQYS